ncbi:hypothetical protein D3C85_1610140 [compost metagenome]
MSTVEFLHPADDLGGVFVVPAHGIEHLVALAGTELDAGLFAQLLEHLVHQLGE